MPGERLSSNVFGMTETKAKEHPQAGAKIRARRAFLGKSRKDIETETSGVIYMDLQKRIESGTKKVRTLHIKHLKAWMEALEWSPADFEHETGVELGFEGDSEAAPAGLTAVPGTEPYKGGLSVGYYGTVRAGLGRVEQEDDPERRVALDPIMPGVRGRDESHLGLLRVNGDSMVSEKAAESIPEGSMVLVEWGAVPAPDEIVVAWLDSHDTAVLKQFKEGKEAVLRSFNPAGPVFRGDSEASVRGVVRMVMRKP